MAPEVLPNYRSALDARTVLYFLIKRHWPGASESERSPRPPTKPYGPSLPDCYSDSVYTDMQPPTRRPGRRRW
jgi:hypothetical protein